MYSHPWETVAQAAWRKYPNPITPSVLGIDVIDRGVAGGVLHSHRLVSSQWGFPKWTKPVSFFLFQFNSLICISSSYFIIKPTYNLWFQYFNNSLST